MMYELTIAKLRKQAASGLLCNGEEVSILLEAYDAATRTPENKPLTREQVMELDDDDAVWSVRAVETSGIPTWVYPAVLYKNMFREQLHDKYEADGECLWFATKPTPEDIRKAREIHAHPTD